METTNKYWNVLEYSIFKEKLIKYKVIENTYHKCINKYLNEKKNNLTLLITDTSFVLNKLGINEVSYNAQIKKHKTSKISIITDTDSVPISVTVTTGKINDSVIFNNQLDKLHYDHPILFKNDKIVLGDAAYDSSILREKIKFLKLGKLLTPFNCRNSKIIKELNVDDKLLLNKRIYVEHVFNKFKKHKRCQLRYDKYINSFNFFVTLTALKIFIKTTNIY